jgi:16S rRNA (uracil1498-N3)-methyltransferase
MAPRFYVDTPLAANSTIDLPARIAHHATHVLRLRDGDRVVVFDGRGGEYPARLADRGARARLEAHDPVEREAPIPLALMQAWIAIDKLEWVVEKAVELGVGRIVLAPARRSVVQLAGARLDRRIERLREIVVAACCQCGRNRLPDLAAESDFAAALAAAAPPGTTGLLLHPDAAPWLPAAAIAGQGFAVAVGPEGGFDAGELALAARHGYRAVRLGARVLRTETAGLAALAALQATVGDFR